MAMKNVTCNNEPIILFSSYNMTRQSVIHENFQNISKICRRDIALKTVKMYEMNRL